MITTSVVAHATNLNTSSDTNTMLTLSPGINFILKQAHTQARRTQHNNAKQSQPPSIHVSTEHTQIKHEKCKNIYIFFLRFTTRDQPPRRVLTIFAALPGHAKTNLYTGRSPPSPIFSCSSRGHTWKKSRRFFFSRTLRMALNGLWS